MEKLEPQAARCPERSEVLSIKRCISTGTIQQSLRIPSVPASGVVEDANSGIDDKYAAYIRDPFAEIDLFGLHEEPLVEPTELFPHRRIDHHESAGKHGDLLKLQPCRRCSARPKASQSEDRES